MNSAASGVREAASVVWALIGKCLLFFNMSFYKCLIIYTYTQHFLFSSGIPASYNAMTAMPSYGIGEQGGLSSFGPSSSKQDSGN